jgi:predicted amidophosphoribosyltransferase
MMQGRERNAGPASPIRPASIGFVLPVAYGDIARAVALKLKYAGRPGVAETMARLMSRHVGRDDPDAILVPVPLHRWRIWKRGYNQAALIASALSRRTGLRTELALIERTKATPR